MMDPYEDGWMGRNVNLQDGGRGSPFRRWSSMRGGRDNNGAQFHPRSAQEGRQRRDQRWGQSETFYEEARGSAGGRDLGGGAHWRSQPRPFSSEGGRSRSIDPYLLVELLGEYPNFRGSLLSLMEDKGLHPSKVREAASAYSQVFCLEGEDVVLRPKVGLCLAHAGPRGCLNRTTCTDIHICPRYVSGLCHNRECVLGHKWKTDHNRHILQQFYIDRIHFNELRSLIKCLASAAGPVGRLDTCAEYNKGGCSKRQCADLHVCRDFIAGFARCTRAKCKLNHSLETPECSHLLAAHGFSINESPRDIVRSLMEANPSLKGAEGPAKETQGKTRSPDQVRSDASQDLSGQSVWTHHSYGDTEIKELCYYSVEGTCRYEKDGCRRLHSVRHYHWQVSEKGRKWLNLRPPQVKQLEIAFCKPEESGADLPRLDPSKQDSQSAKSLLKVMGRDAWKADFAAMTLTNSDQSSSLRLRRLCTEEIDGKPVKANTFRWYFLDKNRKWVQYGKVDTAGETNLVSSVTSVNIEKHFKQKKATPLTFTNTQFKYVLDFASMTQTNQQTQVSRKVCRRPRSHIH